MARAGCSNVATQWLIGLANELLRKDGLGFRYGMIDRLGSNVEDGQTGTSNVKVGLHLINLQVKGTVKYFQQRKKFVSIEYLIALLFFLR